MALKMLILRSKKEKLEKDLAKLRAKDEEFQTREAELEAAIAEMDENTSEEDRTAVEDQVETLTKEKEENEEAKGNLEKEIEKIEGLERIRFMTSHPKDLSDELIAAMKDSKKICNQGTCGSHWFVYECNWFACNN